MAISFVAAGNDTSTAVRNTVSPPVPDGTEVGDLMIAFIPWVGADPESSSNFPVGWELFATITAEAVSQYTLWWKFATFSEPASYTWTIHTGDSRTCGSIVSYRGVRQDNPISALSTNQNTSGSGLAVSSNTTENQMFIVTGHINRNDSSAGTVQNSVGDVERVQISSEGSGRSRNIGVWEKLITEGGTENRTISNSATANTTGFKAASFVLHSAVPNPVEFLDTYTTTSSQTTYTFNDVDFGEAHPDRHIIVCAAGNTTSGSFSSATIGGVSATVTLSGAGRGIIVAKVPTGTSGTVVVTFSNSQLRCILGVYRGLLTTTAAFDTDNTTSTDHTITMDSPENGCITAFSRRGANVTYVTTGAVEDYVTVLAGANTYVGGHLNTPSGIVGHSITLQPSSGNAATFGASWSGIDLSSEELEANASIDVDLDIEGSAGPKSVSSASDADLDLGIAATVVAKHVSAETEMDVEASVEGSAARTVSASASLAVDSDIDSAAVKAGQLATTLDIDLTVDGEAAVGNQARIDLTLGVAGIAQKHTGVSTEVEVEAVLEAVGDSSIFDRAIRVDIIGMGFSRNVGIAAKNPLPTTANRKHLGATIGVFPIAINNLNVRIPVPSMATTPTPQVAGSATLTEVEGMGV